MRIATFNSFASKICAGSLDAIEPELRERAVVDTLKRNSWIELIGYTAFIVVVCPWAIAFARAISGGYPIPAVYPFTVAGLALLYLTIIENRGRDRVKKEFVARYKKSEKSPNPESCVTRSRHTTLVEQARGEPETKPQSSKD